MLCALLTVKAVSTGDVAEQDARSVRVPVKQVTWGSFASYFPNLFSLRIIVS